MRVDGTAGFLPPDKAGGLISVEYSASQPDGHFDCWVHDLGWGDARAVGDGG